MRFSARCDGILGGTSQPEFRRIDDNQLDRTLPPRRRTAHKGDFGHVLVVGGGAGMPGAVRLCAEAALRTGAGRVSVATDPVHAALIVSTAPELMSHGVAGAADLDSPLTPLERFLNLSSPGRTRSDSCF